MLHHRFGHPNFVSLFPQLFVDFELSKFQCQVCELSKRHRVLFPSSNKKSEIPFSVIHSDVWGPSRVTSYLGYKWFVSFIDDCTRTTWIYLLQEKSEVANSFKTFHKMIQTQFHTKIQVLRTNNGKEYFNTILKEYFKIRSCSEVGGWRPCIERLSFMRLASSEAEGLEIHFSKEEVFVALIDPGKDKAQGLYHDFLVVLLGCGEDWDYGFI